MTKEDAKSSTRLSEEASDLADGQQEQAKFAVTPDMQTYIDYKKVSGVEVASLDTEIAQQVFLREYHSWVKAGRPRPNLPNLKIEEDPIPMKLYRFKHYGTQKIFWRDTNGKMYGKEEVDIPIERRITDSTTGKEEVTVERIKRGTKYSIDYNKQMAEKLVDDALKRCEDPTFYFILRNGSKQSINPADFYNADYDELEKRIKEGAYAF